VVPYLSLLEPEIYVAQLARLQAKFKTRRHAREPLSEGVSLSELRDRGEQLCHRIAETVRAGTYRFSHVERVALFVDGKYRTIHRPNLLDAIVLGALSQRLTALLEPVLDDNVYAYRPGRNPQFAIERVCDYLASHRHANPDLRQRGVLVLQRDLSAYGESIPTNPDSKLWELLDSVTSRAPDRAEATSLRSLVAEACRPQVRLPSGEVVTMTHGLPTGSPIQQPLANLYLAPLDRHMREIGPDFYARFGDDLLVLDPRLERTLEVRSVLDDAVRDLGLTFNPTKTRDLYFTGPGRPFGGDSRVEFQPASHLEYLGVRLNFHGKRGLKRKRLRQLLLRSRLRIENTVRIAPSDNAVEFVATALGNALHGNDGVADPATDALRSWVDDREQLRQLDYQLAKLCAEAIAGKRGVRAFRHTTPQKLRDCGLRSLLELRRRTERRS
jgi:hypothetical protein